MAMILDVLEKCTQLKDWTLDQICWAETSMKGKSGAEKKAAVIKKLDDMIVLPFYLEWMDDMVLSFLVDKICSALNEKVGKNFITKAFNTQELLDSVKIPQDMMDDCMKG